MATETHQTETPPVQPQGDLTVITPRAEEAQTPPPDAGDLDEKAAREAKERMSKTQGFWNRITPETEKDGAKPGKPAEAPPEKPPKKGDKPPVAEPPKPAPETKPDKKPARRQKATEVDPLVIARETGREIGREIAKANQPAAAPPAATPDVEFPEEYKDHIPVFDEMARLDPKRYANLRRDIQNYAKAESEYIAKWEKEHEGQEFDGDSDEHDAFYGKIRPNYEDKDFKAAERSLLKAEMRKELAEEIQAREVESEQRRERAAQVEPDVAGDLLGTLGAVLKEVDPENAELAKDWSSLRNVDEKNWLASRVLRKTHDDFRPIVIAAMRLFRFIDKPNMADKNHVEVFKAIGHAENAIARLPLEDRYDDEGRLFAPQVDYAKMSPEEQARHWYIDEAKTLVVLRGKAVKQAKEEYNAKKEEYAMYNKHANATRQPNHEQSIPSAPGQQAPHENGSPSVSGRGTLPGDGKPAPGKAATGHDMFFSKILGA